MVFNLCLFEITEWEPVKRDAAFGAILLSKSKSINAEVVGFLNL